MACVAHSLGGGSVIDVPEWQSVLGSAISRRHAGDVHGAIAEMVKTISLTKPVPELAEVTATSLNYLADIHFEAGAYGPAVEALRESIELTRPRLPLLLACNLSILAAIQSRQGRREEALASAEEARRLCQDHGHHYGLRQADELLERIRITGDESGRT